MTDRILLIAKNAANCDFLREFVESVRPETAGRDHAEWMPLTRAGLTFEDQLRSAAAIVAAETESSSLSTLCQRTVCLVDDIDASKLDAASETGEWGPEHWHALIASLILAFPDVLWLGHEFEADAPDALVQSHSSQLLRQGKLPDPMWSGSRLRDHIRATTNARLAELDMPTLPIREKLAASIDEETNYTHFHAYTAYRFGTRAVSIADWRDMIRAFDLAPQFGGPTPTRPHPFWMLLEDMNLNFADRPPIGQLARLAPEGAKATKANAGRADVFPALNSADARLEPSEHRALITSGRMGDREQFLAVNKAWLRRKKHGRGSVAYKPARGMFQLWRCATSMPPYELKLDYAEGFDWPPPRPDAGSGKHGRHGAVGKLQLVSEMLIERAENIVEGPRHISSILRGAVLATEAHELTCLLTPTLAVQTLAVKHRLEVAAECQFAGLEHHIDIRRRRIEIKRDCELIAERVDTRVLSKARLNAELRVLNGIVLELREHNLFDEEQECMARIRWLHNCLWFRTNPLIFPVLLVFAYVQFLLRSPMRLVMSLAACVLLLTWAFNTVGHHEDPMAGFSAAFSSFFSIGAPVHPDTANTKFLATSTYVALIDLAMFLGFIHLGVFISHLYSLTMRR